MKKTQVFMEPIEKGKAALLSGIETDLRSEEQQIINEAQKKAAEKRKYAEKKIESILNKYELNSLKDKLNEYHEMCGER